jgi:hypothetical protein
VVRNTARVNDPAAQEEWARCWLVAWSTAGRATYAEAKAGTSKPDLAIDLSDDEIRVVDLKSNAVVAKAPLAQATASPAARMGSYFERRYAPKGLPVLVVNIPGAQQLTIGCIEPAQKPLSTTGWRFAWRGTVPRESDPAFLVSGSGWLTLVERFGLASQLRGFEPPASSTSGSGPPPLYTPPKYAKTFHRIGVAYFLFCVVFLVALLIIAAVLHQW